MKDERTIDDFWPVHDFQMFERQTWILLERNCISCYKSVENESLCL